MIDQFLRSFHPRLWPYYITEILFLWFIMPLLNLDFWEAVIVVVPISGVICWLAFREIDRINAENK